MVLRRPFPGISRHESEGSCQVGANSFCRHSDAIFMIDATAFGTNHIQVFHTQGMSAHSILLTRNDALELLRRLREALNEKQETEALIPDD